MKKVKDINGNVLKGVYRAPNGTLIVKDNDSLMKHSIEINNRLQDKRKIENLEKTVEELSELVKSLIGAMK